MEQKRKFCLRGIAGGVREKGQAFRPALLFLQLVVADVDLHCFVDVERFLGFEA